jgi:hypothetical protein
MPSVQTSIGATPASSSSPSISPNPTPSTQPTTSNQSTPTDLSNSNIHPRIKPLFLQLGRRFWRVGLNRSLRWRQSRHCRLSYRWCCNYHWDSIDFVSSGDASYFLCMLLLLFPSKSKQHAYIFFGADPTQSYKILDDTGRRSWVDTGPGTTGHTRGCYTSPSSCQGPSV